MFHILFQVFIYCVLALPPVGTIQTGCEIIPEHGHQRLLATSYAALVSPLGIRGIIGNMGYLSSTVG